MTRIKGNIIIIIVLAIIISTFGFIFMITKNMVETNIRNDNRPIENSNINSNTNDTNNYIETTSDKIRINITEDNIEYAEISIENGNLNVKATKYKRETINNNANETKDETYIETNKTISIPDEKAKYITSMYYQPGATTYVVILTEKGNVYTNNISAINQTIDNIDNFRKTEYTNIKGLVKLDNSDSNSPDPVPYYFGAVTDNKIYIMKPTW